jgi:hypothetical protein
MKNTVSTLKKSAVFVALFASASAAYASNSEYTQPINLNAGGAEIANSIAPVINVDGAETAIQNQVGDTSATGGAVNSKIDNVVQGHEIANNAGGAEVANSNNLDNSNGGVTGTIADNSHTINNAGGAELALQNDVSNGGVHSVNNAGGAELALQNDVSNGGVTGTITDKSITEIAAGSDNKLTQEQLNQQDTDVDLNNSNSGNSKNKNTQNTSVGGNNSSYTNYHKSGAATNIPQAAAILATKNCVSSLNVGFGLGEVYAGYGGLSFAYVGSGAVELKGTVLDDTGNEVAANYTIPELADLAPQKRTPIFDTLRGSDPELATCLMGNYIAQERSLTKAYDQATKVANINADAHVNGIVIQAEAKMFIASLQAKNNIDVQRIVTLGEAFNAGVRHFCGLEAVVLNQADGSQIIHKDTLPIREEGHESCEQVVWGIYGELTDNRPVAEKPDFTKYLKGKHAAPKR